MNKNTKSEDLFELFCNHYEISWKKVSTEENNKTPDYSITLNGQIHYFEIKQLDKDINFNSPGVHSRIVGNHIRKKIEKSQKQIQFGAKNNAPSILLIYNNLDPIFQAFGTEQLDFITAMYGEPTVKLSKNDSRIVESCYGLNSKFGSESNTTFSAIGHLKSTNSVPIIYLYENHYAVNPLNFELLPSCFKVIYQSDKENK